MLFFRPILSLINPKDMHPKIAPMLSGIVKPKPLTIPSPAPPSETGLAR